MEERWVMTVEEAARALDISRGLAYRLARENQIPVVHLGRRLVIPRKALEDLLSSRQQPVTKD